MYVCTHTYIRIYLYILYIFIYVYKHTYMCVHTYIYIYTYICVHIYIYPRIYEDCSRFSGPTFVYRHCSLNKDITFFFFFFSIYSFLKETHAHLAFIRKFVYNTMPACIAIPSDISQPLWSSKCNLTLTPGFFLIFLFFFIFSPVISNPRLQCQTLSQGRFGC